jgi:uncharacterized protein involved in outer membrane biogenesis
MGAEVSGVVSVEVVTAGVSVLPLPSQAQSIKSIAKTSANNLIVFLVIVVLLYYIF